MKAKISHCVFESWESSLCAVLPSASWVTFSLPSITVQHNQEHHLLGRALPYIDCGRTVLLVLLQEDAVRCRLSRVKTETQPQEPLLFFSPSIPSQAIALRAIISCWISCGVFQAHTPQLACSSKRKTQRPLAPFCCLAPFLSHYCSISWYCSLICGSGLASLWGLWLFLPVSSVRVLISAALGRISLRRVSGASLEIWPFFSFQILFFPDVNGKPGSLCFLVSIQADIVLSRNSLLSQAPGSTVYRCLLPTGNSSLNSAKQRQEEKENEKSLWN